MDQMKCVKEYVAMENSGRRHKYVSDEYKNDGTSHDIRRMCLDKGRKEASRLIWGLSRNPTKLRQYLKSAANFDHWKVAYKVGYEEYMNDLLETPTQIDRYTLKEDASGNDQLVVNLFGGDAVEGTAITNFIQNTFRICNCKNGKSYAVSVPDTTVAGGAGAGCDGVGNVDGVNQMESYSSSTTYLVMTDADRKTCENGNLDFNNKCYKHAVSANTVAVEINGKVNPALSPERRNFMWVFSNLENADTYVDGQVWTCPTA